jgi:hypothetical protein
MTTPVYITMIGAWSVHGMEKKSSICKKETGDKFSSSRQGESPKQLKIKPTSESKEQHAPKTTSRSRMESVLDFFICMEREFYRASNDTDPTLKFHLS